LTPGYFRPRFTKTPKAIRMKLSWTNSATGSAKATMVALMLLLIFITKVISAEATFHSFPNLPASNTLTSLKSPAPMPSCGGCVSTNTFTDSYQVTTVDGNDAEWNLVNDFWSGMYNAGKITFELTANCYVRYNTSDSTVYVLVLDLNTSDSKYILASDATDAWAAIDANNNKVYTGNSGDNGVPPDFAWVGQGYDGNSNHARGYEASFKQAPDGGINHCFIIHVHVDNIGTVQTAATGSFSSSGVCLAIISSGPPPLNATCTPSNINCFGTSTGSVCVSPSGGTSPYTYLWSNGATTSCINGLAAGGYSVTVTDKKGATATCSSTVSQPTAVLSISPSHTDVSCFGGNNGTASVIASGGTTSYSYLWSNGSTASSISALTSATYTVTVTDHNGCTANTAITVSQPSLPLSAAPSHIDISCFGGNNGIASEIVSGGTSPYTFLWSNGATTASLSGLIAGVYSVTIMDFKGCTVNSSLTIFAPAVLDASCSHIDVTINGGSNGSASVVTSGGTTPYTYLWNNGATTASINNVIAGPYSVTVSDAHGCQSSCTTTVGQPSPLTIVAVPTDALCNGSTNGLINATASGGVGPYTYLWSNGSTTEDLNGVGAGTYTVTVTDHNGATASAGATVGQPAVTSVICSHIDLTINGANNGSASVVASGGTTPYTYLWSNGATTASINNMVAATYSVTVTDAHGCQSSCTTTIGQPDPLNIVAIPTDAVCNGSANGSVNATTSGGVGPYTYLWSNGATTEDISGVGAGTYTVTVTDHNGATASASATVGQPPVMSAICSHIDVTINGGSNGSASVVASGGTTPYTYLWSNGGTTASISGLTAGTYSVTVTDAHGCQSSCTTTVGQPGSLSIIAVPTDAVCNGAINGSVNATASGGVGPYTYLWSNGAATEDISGVGAATYTVTVTDHNGATASASAMVGQPPVMSAICSHIDVTINGGSNGSASVVASGGTTPYTYLWSNGATTASINNVVAGTYSVTVTDAHGCQSSCTTTVGQPGSLSIVAVATNALCNALTNGSINATTTGGVGPYTYLWSNGATTEDLNGVGAASYTVTVTDHNGATASTTAIIGQPAVLSVICSHSDATSTGANNGSASVVASGGTTPYAYLWSNGKTTASITVLTAGTYSVTVTDAHGCPSSCTTTVGQPQCPCVPPTSFTVDSLSAAAAQVCWNNVACNKGYILQWKSSVKNNWQVINVAAGSNCTIFTNQYPDSYDIKVATICQDGSTSAYSTIFVFHTYPSCLPPTGLYTNSIKSNQATTHWTRPADATSQTIQYRKVGTTAFTSKTPGALATSFVLKSLLPNTTYEWQMRETCIATGKTVKGQFSPLVQFTTKSLKTGDVLESENANVVSMKIYPNPADRNVTIDMEFENSVNQSCTIRITNTLGQVIDQKTTSVSGNSLVEQISLSDEITAGLYTVTLIVNGNAYHQQLVVQR
jgi:hypothetical protein